MTDNGSGGLGVVLCHVCQKPVRFAATTIEHLDGSSLCIEAVPLTDNHHLPECWVKYESDPSAWCICDELRACEARVRKVERSNNFTPDDHADAMTEAYLRGLDASREAVSAALSHEDHCKGQIRKICNCSRFDALAAIDALKGQQRQT